MVREERRRALGSVLVGLALVASFVVLLGSVFSPVGAEPQSPAPQAWILVDADTGAVLDGGNFHVPLRPASTTKIMTAVTAVERLDPDVPLKISARAAAQPASKMGASPGEQWSLEIALAGMLLESSNDLAYAVAEAVGDGDLAQWERIVNDTASRLGMRDSHFNDPAGLDAPGEAYSSGPMVSAYDIAIATRNAIAVPTLAAIGAAHTFEFTWPGTENSSRMQNHNKFVPGGDRAYADATGFKTGYTDAAGHTLVATAQRDGRQLIAVVLNTYDMYEWAAQFLDAGFAMESDATGTGERLPDVVVQPFSQRQSDLQAFVALAQGPSYGQDLDAPTEQETLTAQASAAATTVATTTTTPASGTTAQASTDGDTSDGGSTGSAGISTTTLVIGVFALLGAAFLLRRRQITMRKRRRAARRRSTRQAIRRGTLPVADGRPVVASRASSPRRDQTTDSHVKVVPMSSGEPPVTQPRGPAPGSSTPERTAGSRRPQSAPNKPRRATEKDRRPPR